MGLSTQIYSAPATALRELLSSRGGDWPSSGTSLSELGEMAIVRIQALLDGVNGWDEDFDRVAIEMESGDYAEDPNGTWARILPDRFCREVANMSDSDIDSILPEWATAGTHDGRGLSMDECRSFLEELRRLALDATKTSRALILRMSE